MTLRFIPRRSPYISVCAFERSSYDSEPVEQASEVIPVELGLKGRVAIVTGASKGIGRAIALELAGEGCDLAISARGVEQLSQVREHVISRGVRCVARHVDITNPADIEALVAEVKNEFGRLDILVNNAGGARPGTFATLTDSDFHSDYDLKVLGQIRCTRAALQLLEKSPAPRVININAIVGRVVSPGLFATATHRAACFAVNKSLAQELGPKRILVNCVNIGYVLTPQWENIRNRLASGKSMEDFTADRARGVPLGRFGTPEEVSGLVAFLASDRASYISGASIDVGGGSGAHV
jgi:3-oxoacyl-[acyl-carrier protein] reductase